MRGWPKMGGIWHGRGRSFEWAKWSKSKSRKPTHMCIFSKRNKRGEREEDILMKGGQEAPSSLKLAPTNAQLPHV
jgi:hypothetical protein